MFLLVKFPWNFYKLVITVYKKKKFCKGTQILISNAMFKYLFVTWKLAISVSYSELDWS